VGDFPAAVRDFSLFLEQWCCADEHLPELRRARAFMASRGCLLRVVEPEERPGPMKVQAPASIQVLALRTLGKVSC